VSLRDELADVSRESVEQAVAIMGGRKMRPGARKFLNVMTLGVFPLVGAIRKIIANRKAVRAGKPKPHDPVDIASDMLDVAGDAADTLRGKRK